ncbi:MoxR family ATPase [Haladaptatus sp. F3-133]|jgi:MoxR-like ATPase|uniref:MoxR family ATPase n=1 Tax=Halorutilus salinus TaxID=2487751 RepID=A0A9Q4C2Y6_9EURY|nr:MoxR family ATPase [Halorutilus salinus]MCX2818895.1 MoxR family ATPase [Halorutilus salinus]
MSQQVEEIQEKIERVRGEVSKKIVGLEDVLERLLVCMVCDGNALLESNPGLAKTMMVRTVADVTDMDFSRIQNTPDLMPSDVTGTEVIRESATGDKEFVFEKGPVFANIVLADEINRATPKTQASFLEAMEEEQVTAGGETYDLPRPFFVLATQNPIDQEGTYPLPEAQQDRFMLKLTLDYPNFDEEAEIVNRYTRQREDDIEVERVLTKDELLRAQELVRDVPVADDIRDRAINLVSATRDHEDIEFGASPRATLSLVLGAKGLAFLRGRSYVSEEDLEEMAIPVLRHRIIVDFRAEREGRTEEDVVREILK